MTVWSTKYTPQKLADIFQSNSCLLAEALLAKRHVLLSGPVGCGKTAAVYAFALEQGWEVFELNASDSRAKSDVESLVGSVGLQMSLFFRHKVILIDEVEGLSGTDDRGGVGALAALLSQMKFPVVVATTDPDSEKLKPLRKQLQSISFSPVETSLLVPLLEHVCRTEGILYQLMDLKQLAKMSGGDVRAALNDLQTHSCFGAFDLSDVVSRDPQEDLADAFTLIFKGRDLSLVRDALERVTLDLDTSFLWLEENLLLEYRDPSDLYSGLYALSSADIFRSRILRWQYWRFLVYQSFFMTCGLAFAKRVKYPGHFRLKQMTRLLTIWRANMATQKQKGIAVKLASYCHRSTKATFKEFVFYRPFLLSCSDVLALSDDESAWLNR